MAAGTKLLLCLFVLHLRIVNLCPEERSWNSVCNGWELSFKKKKGGMIATFIHYHQCINVGVNWWIMTCVVKRFKLLIRWEKGHINTVHLASLSNNPSFARYMWSTINHMFCSQRAQVICEHSSCCLLCVFRQAWLNCLYLCSVS